MTEIIITGSIVLILILNKPEEFSLEWIGWVFAASVFFLGAVKNYNPKKK